MSYPAWQVVAEVPIQTSLATPVPPRVLYCIASVDFSLTRGPKAVVARPQGSRRSQIYSSMTAITSPRECAVRTRSLKREVAETGIPQH